MTARGAVVRLRWVRGMVTSRVLPLREARELSDGLLRGVIDCGEGTAFVTLTGYDGRTAHVRGREVIAVECVPDIADSVREPRVGDDGPSQKAGTTVQVQTYPSTRGEDGAAAGTVFLRQQAAAQQSQGGRR